ncbi:MAG: hypothetical protein [Siphoviridae sp. ctdEk19]|nr:MAG: hypothetical protein [Siphoviridae sp. ctdEk19]
MATAPVYTATPKVGLAEVSTANTNRDGTGTIAAIFTAGASGSRIERIMVKATGTTTAGMVRLFIHDGSSARLYTELPVQANVPSASLRTFESTLEGITTPHLLPLVLPVGYSLRASTHNAETFIVSAIGGDF